MNNDIIVHEVEKLAPAIVFTPGPMGKIVAKVTELANELVPNVESKAGRDAIRSNAADVARSKTYLDKMRLDFVRDKKAELKAIDSVGSQMKKDLDALKVKVRKPLTDWEEAKKKRDNEIIRKIDLLKNMRANTMGLMSVDLKDRIDRVEGSEINETIFGELVDQAHNEKILTLELLTNQYETTLQQEKDQAELDALRKEKEERAKKEAAANAKKEQQARDRRIRKEATERAKAKAQRDKEAHERRLAEAEERRLADIEAAKKAERDKIAAEEEAKAKAEQDEAHKSLCETEVFNSLCSVVDETTADNILTALKQGDIDRLNIDYSRT